MRTGFFAGGSAGRLYVLGVVLVAVGVIGPIVLFPLPAGSSPPSGPPHSVCSGCNQPAWPSPSATTYAELQALSLLGVGAAVALVPGLRRRWWTVGLGAGLASGVSAAGLLVLATGGPSLVWFFPELWPGYVPYLALRLAGAVIATIGTLPVLTRRRSLPRDVGTPRSDPT